jgi:hypothetical protein
MFNKGDKVSVLDEAINGEKLSRSMTSYRRNRGWIYDDISVNELIKINDSSNLLDSIRRINVDECKRKRDSKTT